MQGLFRVYGAYILDMPLRYHLVMMQCVLINISENIHQVILIAYRIHILEIPYLIQLIGFRYQHLTKGT